MKRLFQDSVKRHGLSMLLVLFGMGSLWLVDSLVGFSTVMFNSSFIPPDSTTYIEAADMLYNDFAPHHLRPLGYAFLLGLPNLFIEMDTHDYVIWSTVLNALAWLLMLLLCFKTLEHWFNRSVFPFILTCALFILFSYYGFIFLVLTEIFTALGLVAAVYLFSRSSKTQNSGYFLTGVSLLVFLVLIRPGLFYLAILAVLYAFIRYRGQALRNVWLSSALLLLVVQCTWMKMTYGNFKPSYIDSVTWYLYTGAQIEAEITGQNTADVAAARHKEMHFMLNKERARLSSEDLKSKVLEHPSLVYKWIMKNHGENVHGGSYPYNGVKLNHPSAQQRDRAEVLLQATLQQNRNSQKFIFWLTLISLLFIRKLTIPLLFCAGTVWYISGTSSISFWQGDRFHMIFYPLLWIWTILLIRTITPRIVELKTRFLSFRKRVRS